MHLFLKEKQWLKCLMVISVAGLAAGCSSSEEQVVSEDHRYLESNEGKVIAVPQGLNQPIGDDDFYMPKIPKVGSLGQSLDIRAPTQLLALASGSRLDENNRTSMIWFDQSEVVDDLPKFTWDAINGYLDGQKVVDSQFDETGKTVQTGWVHHLKESSFWSWSTSDETTSYRYKMTMKMKPHGKSGYVSVALTGYQLNGKDVALASLVPVDRTQAEIGFLNEFVYHFQILQELRMDKSKRTGSTIITLALAKDAQGQQALHSDKDIDTVWVDFRMLLEGLGFTIDDVDRSVRQLFVSYKKPEVGFWDSLWGGSDLPELNLTEGEYIIKVTDAQILGESLISISTKDLQPLAQSEYDAVFEEFVKMAKQMGLSL
ncbi:MAG: outer membrane protein assembly factor BamC [Alteromonadaceae bacterium]